MIRKLSTAASAFSFLLGLSAAPLMAADEHKHDHKITTFESAAAGVKAVDGLIAEVRTKVAKGDFEGLHPTSEEVKSAAEALEGRLGDIAAENKDRFKFNANQLKSVANDLEEAHESKNKDEAEKAAKRMESIRDRLRTLTP